MMPAMAVGITDKLMDMRDVVAMIETQEAARPRKRGYYRKGIAV